MAGKRTRTYTSHLIFGQPSELPSNVLPTYGDMVRLIWKHKVDEEYEEGPVTKYRFVDKNLAINMAVSKLTNVWVEAVDNMRLAAIKT